ncbi:NAD-P-binding protein [Athelia psychrophila]|uniref:NAD-P-binding protein n=1 Tax=Athelia psychrophila TaxID=1759441 RepID=A0A166KIG6_9AGAM|nr:NAD-P-binding protein [Fibularhizoctonia sp. CBS 109695]
MSISEGICQMHPPVSKYSVDEIPDLSGKVIIVTGANAGVGKETVKALLNHNAKVYMAVRSAEKGAAAIADLKASTGKEAIFLKLDLADLKSVKAAAAEFIRKEMQLHVLFNNGGVMTPPIEMVTADGYDLQFGTNVLGHYYFTELLMPLLISTAKTSPDGKARVINTSSSTAYMATPLDFETFKDGPARVKKGTSPLYNQSKMGNAIFSAETARRYGDQGIVSIALNPGNLKSDLQRHMGPVAHFLADRILYPTAMGALTQLWAGTSVEGAELSGQWLIPWARVRKEPLEQMQDLALGAKLWIWLEEQVKNV